MSAVSTPKFHLYFDIPTPVFKARVNMPSGITYPANSIDFDTVTLGAYTDVEFDMTLLLGTADGLDDLGRVRVKLAEVDNIRISRSSKGIQDGTVALADNAYITVLDDFRVWSKLPYFNLDTEGDVIQGQDFKDGNISPGTYNTLIPPKANAGPWMIGYTDGGVMEAEFPGGGVNTSFAVADGATITNYAWDIQDGNLTFGTLASAVIRATFPPGRRWVKLTVTDSNGITHTSRCFVKAIDPADDTTIKGFQVKQNLEIGSQTLDIELYRDVPRTTYPDGTLVMFWWGNLQDVSDRSHIKFCGWIDNENFAVTRQKMGLRKTTTIHCVDIAGRMSALAGFPQALDRTTSDSLWSVMPSLDMHKALWYNGFWHSTAFNLADFIMPSYLQDYDCMILYFSGASMSEQMNSQAQKITPDHYFTCNTQGQLSIIRDWMLDDLDDRPEADPVISENEWNDLSASYNRAPKVYSLKSGAVLVSTAYVVVDDEDTVPLVFSVAPGGSSAFGQGSQEVQDNEALALSQSDLNRSSGHKYERLNARYADFKFTDPTGYNFWNFEPALVKRVQVDIAAPLAAQRGLDFTTFAGQVQSVQVEYNSVREGTSIKASFSIEKEVSGYPAVTFTPESQEDVGFEAPPPVGEPDSGLRVGQEQVALIGDRKVYRTSDFQTPSGSGGPTYDAQNLTADDTLTWVVDPFSPGYITGSGAINGWRATTTKLYRIEDLFGTVVESPAITFATTALWRTIQASFGTYFAAGSNPWLVCISYYGNAAGHTGTWATYSIDGGVTWSAEVLISAFYDSGSGVFNPVGLFMSPRTPGLAYTAAHIATANPGVTHGFKTLDYGATWNEMLSAEDPAHPLPYMARFAGEHYGLGGSTPHTFIDAAVAVRVGNSTFIHEVVGGNLNRQADIIVAAPINTKQITISGLLQGIADWAGFGSVSITLYATTSAGGPTFTKTTISDVSSGGGKGIAYTRDFTYRYNFGNWASADWPKNRDIAEALGGSINFDTDTSIRFSVAIFSNAFGLTDASATLTISVTEIVLDDGTTYVPTTPGVILPINGQAGHIHLPYEDNISEDIYYYGSLDRAGNRQFDLKRYLSATLASVSPNDGVRDYGVNHGQFGIRSYDGDRQKMVLAGTGNDTTALASGDKQGVWVSSNAATAWTNIVAAATGTVPYSAAFSGDNSDTLFIWGPALYMGYSTNFGSSINSRAGNLAALSATKITGIAGGPVP